MVFHRRKGKALKFDWDTCKLSAERERQKGKAAGTVLVGGGGNSPKNSN